MLLGIDLSVFFIDVVEIFLPSFFLFDFLLGILR